MWQFGALAAVARALGRRFFGFTGALLLVALVTFHALPEVLVLFASRPGGYRSLLTDRQMRNWLWYVGPAVASYAIGYLAVLAGKRRMELVAPIEATAQRFRWQHLLLVTSPLYLAAIAGRGYVPGSQVRSYFESGLTGQFLLVGVVLTSFALIARFGRPGVFVIMQSMALLLIGQRLTVVAGLVMLSFLLVRHGWRPSRRQIGAVAAIGLLGSLVLSSARISEGRQGFSGTADAGVRLASLATGASHLLSTETRGQLLDDYVFRVDANSFGALVLDSMTSDHAEPVGVATLIDAAQLSVPRFLNPGKLDSSVEARSEKSFFITHFGLPTDIDLLPGVLGPMIGYAGPSMFFALAAMLGVGMGALDRLLRKNTPMRSVLAVGVVNSIMYYERGLAGAAVTIRGVIVIIALMQAVRLAERAALRGHVLRPQLTRRPMSNLAVSLAPSGDPVSSTARESE